MKRVIINDDLIPILDGIFNSLNLGITVYRNYNYRYMVNNLLSKKIEEIYDTKLENVLKAYREVGNNPDDIKEELKK